MTESNYQLLRLMIVIGVCFVECASASAQITTLLDDQFDAFELGTTWQAHGDGAPELSLGIVQPSPFISALQLHSDNVGNEFRGVETISLFSLTGLTNITVDVRLRPINQGIDGTLSSAEVALLGESGEFVRAFASNNVGPDPDAVNDWADFYADSKGNETRTAEFAHCFFGGCDSLRRFVLTVHETGAIFEIRNQDESHLSTATTDFTIADLGSNLTVALRHETLDGLNEVIGWFDSISVTTDPNFVPPGVDPDYNDNGVVDAADYTIWRDTLGSMTDLRADGDGSGVIDQPDYDKWSSNFGMVLGSGAVATVPEPATIVLALLSLACGTFLGVRQRDEAPVIDVRKAL